MDLPHLLDIDPGHCSVSYLSSLFPLLCLSRESATYLSFCPSSEIYLLNTRTRPSPFSYIFDEGFYTIVAQADICSPNKLELLPLFPPHGLARERFSNPQSFESGMCDESSTAKAICNCCYRQNHPPDDTDDRHLDDWYIARNAAMEADWSELTLVEQREFAAGELAMLQSYKATVLGAQDPIVKSAIGSLLHGIHSMGGNHGVVDMKRVGLWRR